MMKFMKWGGKKPAIFLLVFGILFSRIFKILVNPGMINYQMMATFPDEPAGSLDAVYIGSSHSFTFFQGPIAWERYGMTVRIFSSDGQPMACREYFIRYAQKKHPNSLYIITINLYATSFSEEQMHWAADFFPDSAEKYHMISRLTSLSGYSFRDKLSIYFPFIQFHSRWKSLTHEDFHRESNGLKGAFYSSRFLNVAENVTESYHYTKKKGELNEETKAYYDNFLNYCDEVNLNALFVIPPICTGEDLVMEYNSVQSLLESRGYKVLNLIPMARELGMDFETDYYNASHTNIHGSLKFTDYIASYLHENYSFSDKRGNPAYASWDKAYDKYKRIIAPSLTEEELNGIP